MRRAIVIAALLALLALVGVVLETGREAGPSALPWQSGDFRPPR